MSERSCIIRTITILTAAIVNGDGEVTVEDVTLLQRYLAEFDVRLV